MAVTKEEMVQLLKTELAPIKAQLAAIEAKIDKIGNYVPFDAQMPTKNHTGKPVKA